VVSFVFLSVILEHTSTVFRLVTGGGELYIMICLPRRPVTPFSRDPHVGLAVCMDAFEKIPVHMRTRLASQTNGTRFIGGSADTLYIPGRYVEDFMKVLGFFLETDCFLEIATPTALHLVVPPEDSIQYVDHVSLSRAYLRPLSLTIIVLYLSGGYGNHRLMRRL
jgi:hypothetical protein